MEQRIIKLSVKNEYILGEGVVIGAAGSHDEVLLELDFRASPVWHGTTKKAVFYDALGTNPTTILLTTDKLVSGETEVYRISVPAEAKGQAGKCFLTIEGVVTSGETESVRVVTEAAQFDVLQSRRYEQTSDPNPVTPTQAEQLQAEIDDIKNTVSEAKDSADAAEAFTLDPAHRIQKLNLHFTCAEDRDAAIASLAGEDVNIVYCEKHSIEITHASVTKGTGLLALAAQLGIPAEETIAVGDADNDLPMLRAAGLGVAMGNANENARAASDVTVADNDHDGCAEAIHRFLLG